MYFTVEVTHLYMQYYVKKIEAMVRCKYKYKNSRDYGSLYQNYLSFWHRWYRSGGYDIEMNELYVNIDRLIKRQDNNDNNDNNDEV